MIIDDELVVIGAAYLHVQRQGVTKVTVPTLVVRRAPSVLDACYWCVMWTEMARTCDLPIFCDLFPTSSVLVSTASDLRGWESEALLKRFSTIELCHDWSSWRIIHLCSIISIPCLFCATFQQPNNQKHFRKQNSVFVSFTSLPICSFLLQTKPKKGVCSGLMGDSLIYCF